MRIQARERAATGALRMDWPKSTPLRRMDGLDHAIPGAPTEIYSQFSVEVPAGVSVRLAQCRSTLLRRNARTVLVWSGDNRSRFMYVAEDQDLRAASDYEDALGTSRSQNTLSARLARTVRRRQVAPCDLPHQAELEHHRQ